MNEELRKFIRIYLDLEQAYDTSGGLQSTLHAFNASYVDAVKEELSSILENRDLSIDEYENLTSIEFEDEDSLYAYLASLYEYLFEGGNEQPVPPE